MAKILLVLDISFDKGGPSVHLMKDVIAAGVRKGHKIDVILKQLSDSYDHSEYESQFGDNVRFFRIAEPDEKQFGFVRRYLNEIRYAKKCSDIFFRQGHYDAVFLQSNTVTYFYMRLIKKLRSRIVYNVQDIFPYNLKFSRQLPYEAISFPIMRKLQSMGYGISDKIITISDDMKQLLIDDGVKAEKIEVVYNWSYGDDKIELEKIPENRIFDLKADGDKFKVVYAGNIGKMQNVELIVDTARRMAGDPTVHFYIIGEGANKQKLIEMAEGLPNVSFLPMQPSEYAESIYAQADLNVIPLREDIVKTALPSKTATILRVDKPIVFCVGNKCKLADLFKDVDYVCFSSSTDTAELEQIIRELQKTSAVNCNRANVIQGYFSKNNADKYIDCMLNGIDG